MMLFEDEKERQLNHLLETRLNYRIPVKHFKKGGTSLLYETTWGPNDDVPVVVKVDNIPESPRAKRHVERGYDVGNELRQAAKIDHDGVVRIRDFFTPKETSQVGLDGWVIVQDKFVDSVDLEELVSQEGPLSEKDFRQIMLQVANTVMDIYNQYGILHRDLKPSNIAVRRNGKIKTKILDYANAGRAEDMKEKVLATAGGKDVMPPWLLGNGKYDVRAEIYEICSTGMFAARRKPVFDVDPEKGRIKDWDTGESIAENGEVDVEKYKKALRSAVRKLPRSLRKFKDVMYKGLSFNQEEGYSSLDDFVSDLEKVALKLPTRKKLKKYGLIGAAALAAGSLLWGLLQKSNENFALKKEVAAKSELADIEEKIRIIRLYEQRRGNNNQSYSDFIEEGRLVGYLEMFKDRRIAYAAFLSPEDTYAAIQAAGGKEDYPSIQKYLYERNLPVGVALVGVEFSSVDMIARMMNNDNYKNTKKEWEKVKADYERKMELRRKALEQAKAEDRIRTIGDSRGNQTINPTSGLFPK